MEFEKFYYPMLIQENHLDTFGHVNNAAYLQILEQARWDLITPRGFGLKVIQKEALGPTILEWHIKFLKELRLRQKIIIETQTLSYEKKIGVLKHVMMDEENNPCCEAVMTFGLFDLKARKLILPTPEWLHAIGLKDSPAE
jgi:thioesterase-3